MPKTIKPSSLDMAIGLAPGLRRSAAAAGNPLRREHLVGIAACGQALCEKTGLGSFKDYAVAALGSDLPSRDDAMAALSSISSFVPAAVEGEEDTRIVELAVATYGLLAEVQQEADLPSSDLIEICAGSFALFALAEEGPAVDDIDMDLAVDSIALLDKGAILGRQLAGDL